MTSEHEESIRIPRPCRPGVDESHPVYEIDVWLDGSNPPIWRSLAVEPETTLDELHMIIQTVMEWCDEHLHDFETRSGRRFRSDREKLAPDMIWQSLWSLRRLLARPPERTTDVALRDLFEELREGFIYRYDFGDNWIHGIRLVDTHEDASVFEQLPCCLDGRRAGPPEDSGGVLGYEANLEIVRNPDPNDEEHAEILEWMGGDEFDPEAFDLDATNKTRRQLDWSFDPPNVVGRKRTSKKSRKK